MKSLLFLMVLVLASGCASIYERCQANFYELGYYDYQGCVQGEAAKMQQAGQAMQNLANQLNQQNNQGQNCYTYQWGNGYRTECR